MVTPAPVQETISGAYLYFNEIVHELVFCIFSWKEMIWNVTGDVERGSIDSEELCVR